LLFEGPSGKRDEVDRLRTRKQIDLFIEREKARKARVERREAEARVRHLNLDLIVRIMLLVLAVAIGISLVIGLLHDPALLDLALIATSAWAALAAALSRVLRPKATRGGEFSSSAT
jgi:uncharacterized membrane protein